MISQKVRRIIRARNGQRFFYFPIPFSEGTISAFKGPSGLPGKAEKIYCAYFLLW